MESNAADGNRPRGKYLDEMKHSLFSEFPENQKNSRLFRQIEKLYILNTINQSLNGDIDSTHMCQVVVENLKIIFSVGIVYIALAYPEKNIFEVPYFLIDGKPFISPPTPIGQGLTSIVLRTQKTLVIQQDTQRRIFELGGIQNASRHPKSWIGVPIVWKNTAFGVMSIQNFDHELFFADEDISFLEAISETIAGALNNAHIYSEGIRRTQETKALLDITKKISASLELEAVLDAISSSAREILTTQTTAVYLLDESTQILKAVAVSGKSAGAILADTTRLGEGIIGAVAVSGRSELISDTNSDSRAIHIEGSEQEAENEKLMAIPLLTQGKTLGVLAIWRNADEPAFSEFDLEFGSALANHAASALVNAKAYTLARLARKEAEDANRTKSQFLATMSHELRTPLNAIINFSFLLAQGTEGAVNREQEDLLGRIETSGKHLLALINDVLDLAKIEAGKLDLSLEVIDIPEFLRETLKPIPALIGARPILFSMDVPDSLPSIRADRMRLRQILLNLLSNAAKFTEQGFIKLKLETHGDALRFTIQDSGIGMDPKDIPRALMEFTQLDSGPDRIAKGTGLGLSIASRFIELHGSKLEAHSIVGEGTSFWFELKLKPGMKGKRFINE